MSESKRKKARRWIYKDPRSPYWQFDFVVGKHRFHGSTGLGDEAEAQAWVEAVRADEVRRYNAASERTGQVDRLRDVSWIAAVDSYSVNILYPNWRGRGVTCAERRFDWLTDWIGESTSVLSVDDGLVARLVRALKGKHRYDDPAKPLISASTVNAFLIQVQAVLTYARDDLKVPLPDEPNWKRHYLATKQRKRIVSAEEIVIIEDAADEDLWNCIEFSLDSGLRKAAVVKLSWSQVDWEAGVIRFLNKGKNGGEEKDKFITKRMAAILGQQRGKHPTAVFTFVAKRTFFNAKTKVGMVKGERYPMTESTYHGHYRDLCDAHGVKDLTIHDLRRSKGSFILRATGSITHAQHGLDHTSVQTTEKIYAFQAREETGRAMEAATAYADAMKERYRARTGRGPGKRRPGMVPDGGSAEPISLTAPEGCPSTSRFSSVSGTIQGSTPDRLTSKGAILFNLLDFQESKNGVYELPGLSPLVAEQHERSQKIGQDSGHLPDVTSILGHGLREAITRVSAGYPQGLDAPFVPSVDERLAASGYRLLELAEGPLLQMGRPRPIIVAAPDGTIILTKQVAAHLRSWLEGERASATRSSTSG